MLCQDVGDVMSMVWQPFDEVAMLCQCVADVVVPMLWQFVGDVCSGKVFVMLRKCVGNALMLWQ